MLGRLGDPIASDTADGRAVDSASATNLISLTSKIFSLVKLITSPNHSPVRVGVPVVTVLPQRRQAGFDSPTTTITYST